MERLSVRAGARKSWKRVAEAGANADGGRDRTDGCELKRTPSGGHTRAIRAVRKITSREEATGVA
jgi:hypothetical protein